MNLDKGFSRVRGVIGGIVEEQRNKGNVKTANLVKNAPDLVLALHGMVHAVEILRKAKAINYNHLLFAESDILELQLKRAKKLIDKAEGN